MTNNEPKFSHLGKIGVLSLSQSLSVILELNSPFYLGENNTSINTRAFLGVNGAMTAKFLKDFGMDVCLHGVFGGFVGEYAKDLIRKHGINHSISKKESESKIDFMVSDSNGVITSVTAKDSYLTAGEYMDLMKDIKQTEPFYDYLILAASPPDGVDNDIYAEIVDVMRKEGCETVIDYDGPSMRLAIRKKPILSVVSKRALRDYFFHGVEEGSDMILDQQVGILSAVRRLHLETSCDIVCETEKGSVYCGREGLFTARYKTKTRPYPEYRHGAFVASFLKMYLFGAPVPDALKIAEASSACVCENAKGEADKEKISEFLNNTELRVY